MNASVSNRDDGYASDQQSYRSSQQLGRPPPPPPTRPTKAASSFIPPSHTYHMSMSSMSSKRPGGRTGSEPQGFPVQMPPQEAPRGKKGLPFLKNPMSTLLLRRKTSQNTVPDLSLSLRNEQVEPAYDPRIRGTRVHDFSAPRPRKPLRVMDTTPTATEKSGQDILPGIPATEPNSSTSDAPPIPPPKDGHSSSKRSSSSRLSQETSIEVITMRQTEEDVPSRKPTAISEKRRSLISIRRKSSLPASLTSMSRNASGASSRGILSSIPKHMKSTSSRFSFDMIGAAKQEKLLEERHRQRQQDKQVGEDGNFVRRDSRFDEFDEDAFDYDAMDYDDGLEERIPGVNADFEDFEDLEAANDPDNDQENFAGFVFQRSDPTTELTTPHSAGLLSTQRDANGDIIGFTATGTGETLDLNQDKQSPMEEVYVPEPLKSPKISTGLGIQGLVDEKEATHAIGQQPAAEQVLRPGDELYFIDGHEFDGEGDGSAFDESIFDLNDTDQYGRPIPGMFASVLSQRNAAQEAKKRESDITSRLSQQSGASQSTAHTSLSADQQSKLDDHTQEEIPSEQIPQPPQNWSANPQDGMAAYQAALAAAAHQAAASGKFRRDSSPAPPADLTVTSPTSSGTSQCDPGNKNALEGYEDDDGGYTSAGLDDYEVDDDAIIAEANASALANDPDGWYGQEFGFYSTPVPQHPISSVLSERNLYQYSHGGYFGPSGANSALAGRVVSREPNLTPITERSEYSNRNSLMSLMPPTSNGGAAGTGAPPLQSPGLAQLAMMAGAGVDDESMSLPALMRLRTKAWGGSQASITSSSREGSPYDRNGAASPLDQQDYYAQYHQHGRKNSAFSLWSQDSGGAGSGSGSPTLTMSMSMPSISNSIPGTSTNPLNPSASSPTSNPSTSASPPLPPPLPPPLSQHPHPNPLLACPPVFEDEETDDNPAAISGGEQSSPASALISKFNTTATTITTTSRKTSTAAAANKDDNSSRVMSLVDMVPLLRQQSQDQEPDQNRSGMGHRHKGSADSISYTREELEGEEGGRGGETRWVMERRRTADSGEIEILRREIIERGRI